MNKELLECAKINFENLERALPPLLEHPYYLIAKGQLDEALGYQTLEERIEKHRSTQSSVGYLGDINGAGCDPDVP